MSFATPSVPQPVIPPPPDAPAVVAKPPAAPKPPKMGIDKGKAA